jgi:pectate lyase
MSRATLRVGFTVISLFYIIAPVQAYEISPIGWASYNTVANPDPCFTPNLNGTTGGAVGPTVTVSDDANFVKYATSTTPGPYIVQVQGTITLTARVDISPNKTIIGIGTDPTITNYNLRVRGQNTSGDLLGYNVIIRNLIIKDVPTGHGDKDGITIQDKAHHVWVDHCTISNCNDGALDISHACDYITVSWNHFYNQNKTCLLGHSPDNGSQDTGHFKVTYHHNFFDGTIQRNPRVRFSFLCHVYNNYYYANTDYGIASTCDANVLAEGNYFKNVPHPMWSILYSGDPNGWLIERDNIYDNSGTPQVNPPESMPEPSTYYSYTLDDANDIPAIVQSYAGAENPYPPHWYSTIYGDFDTNGVVDGNDLKTFVDYWLDTNNINDADYDGDGNVNFYEFALLAQNWLKN